MNTSGKWFNNKDTYNDFSSIQTDAVIYTPPTGKTVFICGYTVSTSAGNTITVKIGTNPVLKFYFGSNGGANLDSVNIPVAQGLINEAITITSTVATNLSVAFTGYVL